MVIIMLSPNILPLYLLSTWQYCTSWLPCGAMSPDLASDLGTEVVCLTSEPEHLTVCTIFSR